MADLVLTWPKYEKGGLGKRDLRSYLDAVEDAHRYRQVLNYRVSTKPNAEGGLNRCYMVHDGAVRGWMKIIEVTYRKERTVWRVSGQGYWPEGWYVVREPIWHPLPEPIPMQGFRGFRYADF